MLALSDAMASLPVVGRHLEPLGGVTAMGVWGYRQVPGFVSASAKAWLTPGIARFARPSVTRPRRYLTLRCAGIVSGKDLDIEWPAPERTPPFWRALQHRRHLHRTSVRYGRHPAQLLDVWRSQGFAGPPGARAGLQCPAAPGCTVAAPCRVMR